MSYTTVLRDAFPHCFAVREGILAEVLAELLAPDEHHSNGSSFAVTADIESGHRKLWLSEASFQRVRNHLVAMS